MLECGLLIWVGLVCKMPISYYIACVLCVAIKIIKKFTKDKK